MNLDFNLLNDIYQRATQRILQSLFLTHGTAVIALLTYLYSTNNYTLISEQESLNFLRWFGWGLIITIFCMGLDWFLCMIGLAMENMQNNSQSIFIIILSIMTVLSGFISFAILMIKTIQILCLISPK